MQWPKTVKWFGSEDHDVIMQRGLAPDILITDGIGIVNF
jgi:hypothetical protein